MEASPVIECQESPSWNSENGTGRPHSEVACRLAQKPVLSAKVFVVPLDDDRHLVYAPLRRAAFVANRRVVQLLASIQRGNFRAGMNADGSLMEFLRRLEIVDAGEEAQPITEFRGDPEPTTVTLFLTTACNLRCTYCYAAAGGTPTKFMSLEVAKRWIDFVAVNAKKKGAPVFEIAYHGGGEPTVNWQVMVFSFEYARAKATQLGLRALASSATNGVLKDDRIDWVIANLTGASVSFDGLPSVMIVTGQTVSGKGSTVANLALALWSPARPLVGCVAELGRFSRHITRRKIF